MKPATTAPAAAAVLLVLALLANAAGVASGLNLTSFDDFDRVHHDDGADVRVPACKPHQANTTERCTMAVMPVRVERMSCEERGGIPVPHTFYTDVVGTLALSAYVYLITEKRADAKVNDTELYASLKTPMSFRYYNDLIHSGSKDDKKAEVQEWIELLDAYYADDELLCLRDSIMGEGNQIIKIGDDETDIEMSRVHMIAVDHATKRVDVVFRGTARTADWGTNLNAVWRRRVPNPVEQHARATKHVHLHRGFAKALLGDATSPDAPVANDIACSKDGDEEAEGGTPMKAILCDIKPFMKKEKGYRLYVTGHSLGGATATLFAFFAASADPDATRAGPVHLFTYASPRVGGRTFQDAFKFLEERGKIRHARFRNQKDKVPMLPWLIGMYSHVGVEFRLRPNKKIPIVDYPIDKKWVQKGLGLVENTLSLKEILCYHRLAIMLNRTKENVLAFNNTSLQLEYQMIWGG